MPDARLACRSCGSADLAPVLSLGHTPLANALLTEADLASPEPRFPLELVFCAECTLLQITETVPPAQLFSDYLYFSSFSDTMVSHARALSARLVAERRLDGSSLVLEAASNDGYLLQHYKAAGVPVLGIEPAANIARVAEGERGIPTVCEFFGADLSGRLVAEGRRASVLHAHNVLAHVPDLNGFVEGIRGVLRDDGVAVVEVPQAREMIERLEFDTIYHEHLCYFSLTALHALFARHDLRIARVEELPIHGGSLRLFAVPARSPEPTDPTVAALLEREARLGMKTLEYYAAFAGRVERLKTVLVELLGDLRRAGRRLAAYGAAAKGSTLLNTFGIGRETLDFVVDRSTYKQGKMVPGVRLPIRPPSALLEDKPDYVLLLTWNFCDEILEQQAAFRRGGGRFIVPIPEVRILG